LHQACISKQILEVMNINNELQNELEICRKQISQLKMENEDLIESLFKVNEKLRDSEQLKGHFISNITNEIVNPFSSVLALAQNIIQLKDGDILQAHRMAELIFMEAFHLDFQLKNIFAAALIEAGKETVKRTHFDIPEICKQLELYFDSLLKKKNIRLFIKFQNFMSQDEPISFKTDKDKVDLILKNLISNSIKFSPDHSIIELWITRNKEQLSVEVSDHGKGINENDCKIIFDRFKQIDERINSINTGHGLGLSIVQSYAEMLGGQVILDENSDGGLRIKVSIPERDETENWDELEDFIFDAEAGF
jgi:signal transduction histidine kinase